MYRTTPLLAVVLVGCSSATIQGKLVDELHGSPIAEMRIIAKSVSDSASMSCQAFEATTDAQGAFTIEGACTGTEYTLSLTDDSWFVPDAKPVPDGGAAGLTLNAWRAGSGSFRITGDEFKAIRVHTDVRTVKLFDSEESVSFPWDTMPGKVPLIGPGEHLALLGKHAANNIKVLPLVPSGPRRFGNKDAWEDITVDWWYIGVEFTDDENWTRVERPVDASKVITKEAGEMKATFIAHDAYPAGRYVLKADEGRTLSVVDLGKAYEPPAPAEPAAE